jgi:hypothetical protein
MRPVQVVPDLIWLSLQFSTLQRYKSGSIQWDPYLKLWILIFPKLVTCGWEAEQEQWATALSQSRDREGKHLVL